MVTLPPGLTTETGYATNYGSLSGWPVDPAEHVPELIYPLSIQVYDRMRRGDDQIKAVLNAITLPILRAPWRIDPNGAAPNVVQQIASDLGLPVVGQEDVTNHSRRRGAFGWGEHLRLALLHLPYGHMGFELICDTNRGDGLAHLDRLSPRMPVTIGRLETDRSGHLVAVYQFPTTLPGPTGQIATAITPNIDKDTGMVKIPGERLVWYVNELEGAAWQGNSIFRAAYGLWSLKNRALRVNAIKDERNGIGIPVYEAAQSEQDLSKGKQLANDLRAGESAGAAIPNGSKLSLLGVTGQLPNILDSLNFYNEGMARVMLTQFLNLGTTKTGSRALGDSFIDFFKMALDAVTGNIADTVTCHVIEPLVNWNYGEDTAAPRLVCDNVDLETDLPPDSLVALVSSGVLTNDEGTEQYVRARFHLPKLSGPSRPVQKPESAFALPNLPVTARARERAVQAKSSGSKADTLAEADRARTHVEQVHKALLKPAWLSMVGRADLSPVLDHLVGQSGAWAGSGGTSVSAASSATNSSRLTGWPTILKSEASESKPSTISSTGASTSESGSQLSSGPIPPLGMTSRFFSEVRAAADPSGGWAPIVAPVVVRQLQAVQHTASGQRVESIVNASILAGHAQGDVQAQLFLNATRDDGLTPLPPYDARAAIDGWWNDTLGATSRRVAQALSDALDEADTLDRTSLLDVMLSELEDTVDAEFFLDDAMSWSLSQGAMDRYTASGVSQVEFLTAEDSRVDEPCSDAEAGNPWSLGSAPTPPLHANCRCAIAPL